MTTKTATICILIASVLFASILFAKQARQTVSSAVSARQAIMQQSIN